MNHQINVKIKSLVVLIVLALFGLLILWEYNNGGVAVHHLLHRADLPGISNWWGFLLLPIVTLFSLFDVEKRLKKSLPKDPKKFIKKTLLRLLAGVGYGVLLCVLFLNESILTGFMVPALAIVSFFLPLYYSEYWLGFVLGCMYWVLLSRSFLGRCSYWYSGYFITLEIS